MQCLFIYRSNKLLHFEEFDNKCDKLFLSIRYSLRATIVNVKYENISKFARKCFPWFKLSSFVTSHEHNIMITIMSFHFGSIGIMMKRLSNLWLFFNVSKIFLWSIFPADSYL